MSNEETNQSSAEVIVGKAARLDVNGVPVATGRVCFYANPDRGTFWPDDPVRLERPLTQGTLALVGTSMRIRVQDLHQCSEDPSHWNFMIAAHR
jgi:hypothetical protein